VTSYNEAIALAGLEVARARQRRDSLTPREAAAEAHTPGGPDVDELERRIAAQRGSVRPVKISRLEDQFCKTCGRVEKVEVAYDVMTHANGERQYAPLSAKCRMTHEVNVDDLF
jgi:hypothetical protein